MAYASPRHITDPVGQPSAAARRSEDGSLTVAVLRGRATLRAAIRQSGLSMAALEDGFPNLNGWLGGARRRGFPHIARGETNLLPDGNAMLYDPLLAEQAPLWKAVFAAYSEAKNAYESTLFRALDPTPLLASEARVAFNAAPMPIRLMRLRPRQRLGRTVAMELGFTAEMVRQLATIGRPNEVGLALMVARHMLDGGDVESVLDCRGAVMCGLQGPALKTFFCNDLDDVVRRAASLLKTKLDAAELDGTGHERALSWIDAVDRALSRVPSRGTVSARRRNPTEGSTPGEPRLPK